MTDNNTVTAPNFPHTKATRLIKNKRKQKIFMQIERQLSDEEKAEFAIEHVH